MQMTEIVFLILVESLNIATLNSTCKRWLHISISVLKLQHLKIDDFESMHSRKQAISNFLYNSV